MSERNPTALLSINFHKQKTSYLSLHPHEEIHLFGLRLNFFGQIRIEICVRGIGLEDSNDSMKATHMPPSGQTTGGRDARRRPAARPGYGKVRTSSRDQPSIAFVGDGDNSSRMRWVSLGT